MSSRVQKGGTLFRPVAKTRGRPSTESTSHTSSDNFNNAFPNTLSSSRNESSTAMSPPLTIPRHSTLNLSTSVRASESQTSQNDTSISVALSTSASPAPSQQPPPVRTLSAPRFTEATAIAVPSRSAPTPLVIGQSRHSLTTSRTIAFPFTKSTTVSGIEPVVAPLTTQISTPVQVPASQTQPVGTVIPITEPVCGTTGPGELDSVPVDPSSSSQATPSTSVERIPRTRKRAANGVDNQQDGSTESPTKRPRRSSQSKNPTTDDHVADTDASSRELRRRVSSSGNTVGSGDSDDNSVSDLVSSHSKSKRRSSTVSSRPRQSKGPSLPPYDPGTSGTDLDPTAVTMANLCKDTGQGRVSSKAIEIMNNHIAWKTANREKRARMIALMEAKKFGRNLEQEEEAASRYNSSDITANERTATPSAPSTDVRPMGGPDSAEGPGPSTGEAPTGDFDYSQSMTASRFNVQVRIGPSGETVVDEESLFVDTSAEQDTEHYTHVEESDLTKFVNSATHSKKYRGSRWTAEETDLFYHALAQFGENYELISYVLPGRDRKACKNKFKAEDKKNPTRINYCLKNRVPYDITTLSRMTGKDFSGPTPVIRAPTPAKLVESDQNIVPVASDGANKSSHVTKNSRTPSVVQGNDDDEEVLGDVDNFDEKDDDT